MFISFSNWALRDKKIKMGVNFLNLKGLHEPIREEIDSAIRGVVDSCGFILGDAVSEFEEAFGKYCGAKFGIGVDSGTSALQLALEAAGIGIGDEVIVPANTFIATALAVSSVGAKPVFVDVDENFLIDIQKVGEKVSDKTKAVIPVHLYGRAVDMDSLKEVAAEKDLKIVEDCCQAHGAELRGRKVPVSGIGAFSFYPGKNLGGFGDGGIVVTDNEEVAEKVKMLRDYGQKEKYKHEMKGYNRRLDSLQAAVLNVKLKHLDEWNNSRRKVARLYGEFLEGSNVTIPVENPDGKHVYHLYVVLSQKRDELQKFLGSKEVQSGLHYPIPIHLQGAYSEFGLGEGSFPNAEKFSRELLSLPMCPTLSEANVKEVAEAVQAFGKI